MKPLPVPIEFELPGDAWAPTDPDALDLHTAAFVALRQGGETTTYTPILTISGDWRTDGASVEQIGEESLDVLAVQASDVRLIEREQHGSQRAPALTQLLGATAAIGDATLSMRQGQVVTAMPDVEHPERAIVVLYTVTCTEEQFEVVGREFGEFMATVRPVAPPGVPTPR